MKNDQEQLMKIEIADFPMQLKLKYSVTTNFGTISHGPHEYLSPRKTLGETFQERYYLLLNELYDSHIVRGGIFPGEDGCKAWVHRYGPTVIELSNDRFNEIVNEKYERLNERDMKQSIAENLKKYEEALEEFNKKGII